MFSRENMKRITLFAEVRVLVPVALISLFSTHSRICTTKPTTNMTLTFFVVNFMNWKYSAIFSPL
jgi:hypothetical protein